MSWLVTAMKAEMLKVASSGQVEDFLRQMVEMMASSGHKANPGYAYATPYEYFMKNGKKYDSSPLDEKELAILKFAIKGHKLMYKPKECFYNAQRLAQDSSKCRYVEGFLFAGLIPFEHGWNTINGKVVDFTMAHSNGGKPVLGEIPAGREYFGVEFPTKMVSGLWSRTGYSTPLVSNYGEDFPLLKGKGNPNPTEKKVEELPKEPALVDEDQLSGVGDS